MRGWWVMLYELYELYDEFTVRYCTNCKIWKSRNSSQYSYF